jgi:hypothetical protein
VHPAPRNHFAVDVPPLIRVTLDQAPSEIPIRCSRALPAPANLLDLQWRCQDLGPVSAAKGSALPQTQYLTAARLQSLAENLSDRDRELLRFVHDSRFATGHQLVRRFWHTSNQASASARTARRAQGG